MSDRPSMDDSVRQRSKQKSRGGAGVGDRELIDGVDASAGGGIDADVDSIIFILSSASLLLIHNSASGYRCVICSAAMSILNFFRSG